MTTPALRLVMTDAGLARFTAAQLAGAGAELAIATVGLTDQPFVPAPTLTALPGEHRRLASVSGKQVGADTCHLVLRDDEPVAYGLRGIGLFLADGTLFAVYGQAASIMTKSTVSSLLLALDIAFPALNAVAFTFGATDFLNPPASEQARGVIELATQAETDTGTDGVRAVTPRTLKNRLTAVVADLMLAITNAVASYVPLSQKGAAGGVATLGNDGRVPAGQLTPFPVGSVILFNGDAAPVGWAICNGQTVARSDGTGDIVTPDLRGRVAVGVSADRALGATFGAPSVTADTTTVTTGASLTTASQTSYAGNGTQQGVRTVELADPGHKHSVTIDVTQPSLALHYIMKV